MACEEEVHEFFEHVTRVTVVTFFSIVSSISDCSHIIYYLPSDVSV